MKIKRFTRCIMATVIALVGFSACNLDSSDGEKTKPVVPTETSEIKLKDFENYNPDFMNLQINKYFGKIEENSDERYVTSGKKSAKLLLLGHDAYTGPQVFIPFFSNYSGFMYKDLREYEKVKFNVYNAMDFTIPVYVNLEFFSNDTTDTVTYDLKHGWNEVVYSIDHDLLSLLYDLDDCSGMRLSFKNYALELGNYQFSDCPVCYIDDVVLVKSKETYKEKNIIVLDPNEICGFEKLYQEGVILKTSEDKLKLPTTKVVTSENGINPTEGNKMLKLTFENGSVGWPRIYFSDKLMNEVRFSRYKDNAEEYYFAYSVYNATGKRTKISTGYTFSGGRGYRYAEDNYIPTGCWTEYSVSLKLLTEKTMTELGDNYRFFIQFEGKLPEGSTYYFDNFRIVKK